MKMAEAEPILPTCGNCGQRKKGVKSYQTPTGVSGAIHEVQLCPSCASSILPKKAK